MSMSNLPPLTDSVLKADAETQDIRFTPMPVTASHENQEGLCNVHVPS